MQLKADAVAAPEQFHHQHDLPDQRQAVTCCHGKVGQQLGQGDQEQGLAPAEIEALCHLAVVAIEHAGAFSQCDNRIGNLVG